MLKRRPLHERLLAANPAAPVPPVEPGPHWGEVGIHGVARSREWDAVVTATAPGLRQDRVQFVTLPGGDLVVEEGDADTELGTLADAVDAELAPPYRASAVRQDRDVFAVGARRVELVELPGAPGEVITLTMQDEARELEVDGDRMFGGLPALERIGTRAGPSYVVRARRLDGPLFEVEVSPL